jgi:hypothetical protein
MEMFGNAVKGNVFFLLMFIYAFPAVLFNALPPGGYSATAMEVKCCLLKVMVRQSLVVLFSVSTVATAVMILAAFTW